MSRPVHVRLRVYQVGFGDCILLTVTYDRALTDGRRERHLLIDFGSKAKAVGGPALDRVAKLIAEHCGGAEGHLDVVLATHRHADHVAGFGVAAALEHLGPLAPQLILRPWTDGPPDARAPDGAELDPASQGLVATLAAVAELQTAAVAAFGLDRRTTAGRVGALAELGVANQAALTMLDTWTTPDRTRWLRADDVIDAADLPPGVSVRVLGPPTLAQVPELRSYASSSSEYWLQMAGGDDTLATELTVASDDEVWAARETVAPPHGLGTAAFLVDKMHDDGTRQALEIVAGFDDVLNNTSVIVILTIGDRRLLLAGDAQVENWSYALDRALGENGRTADRTLRSALANVDLYKVGHHGSRNATPRRLVDLWRTERKGRELRSVLSTKVGVFDHSAEGTVPKQELVDALSELGGVHSTTDLPDGVWWFDLETPAKGAAQWTHTAGPLMRKPSARRGQGNHADPDEDEDDG